MDWRVIDNIYSLQEGLIVLVLVSWNEQLRRLEQRSLKRKRLTRMEELQIFPHDLSSLDRLIN
jgi:hypothetical protein